MPGGDTPFATERVFQNQGFTELYGEFFIRYSDNWVGHISGVNKIGFMWTDDGLYGNPSVYFSSQTENPGDDFQPQIRTQNGMNTDNLTPNVPGQENFHFPRGRWTRWEYYMRINSPGAADARFMVCMNGVLTSDWTAPLIDQNTQFHWSTSSIAPYWGGTSGTLGASQQLFIDHWTVRAR